MYTYSNFCYRSEAISLTLFLIINLYFWRHLHIQEVPTKCLLAGNNGLHFEMLFNSEHYKPELKTIYMNQQNLIIKFKKKVA